eukprot:GHVU01228996.1.p1 GENE.GHVU01228996.1~~GHVU01228996.1.p1  ORF type:complete len:253 (-),score=28.40 GHVU01228996.1:1-759(-)
MAAHNAAAAGVPTAAAAAAAALIWPKQTAPPAAAAAAIRRQAPTPPRDLLLPPPSPGKRPSCSPGFSCCDGPRRVHSSRSPSADESTVSEPPSAMTDSICRFSHTHTHTHTLAQSNTRRQARRQALVCKHAGKQARRHWLASKERPTDYGQRRVRCRSRCLCGHCRHYEIFTTTPPPLAVSHCVGAVIVAHLARSIRLATISRCRAISGEVDVEAGTKQTKCVWEDEIMMMRHMRTHPPLGFELFRRRGGAA